MVLATDCCTVCWMVFSCLVINGVWFFGKMDCSIGFTFGDMLKLFFEFSDFCNIFCNWIGLCNSRFCYMRFVFVFVFDFLDAVSLFVRFG